MPQRHTKQKEIILTALKELGNHPTADMVYSRVHDVHPRISRATVFRVLRQLSEAGRIGRVAMFDGADCFDHNAVPHFHGRCRVCHQLFDVFCEKPPISSFILSDQCDYEITDYSMMFEGVCPKCRSLERSAPDHGS